MRLAKPSLTTYDTGPIISDESEDEKSDEEPEVESDGDLFSQRIDEECSDDSSKSQVRIFCFIDVYHHYNVSAY